MQHIEELRLLGSQLAGDLDDVLPEGWSFDLRTWYEYGDGLNPCGTSCCAIGLHISVNDTGMELVDNAPFFDEEWGHKAIIKYFGLSYPESIYLFDHISYPLDAAPRMVGVRILQFLDRGSEDNEN